MSENWENLAHELLRSLENSGFDCDLWASLVSCRQCCKRSMTSKMIRWDYIGKTIFMVLRWWTPRSFKLPGLQEKVVFMFSPQNGPQKSPLQWEDWFQRCFLLFSLAWGSFLIWPDGGSGSTTWKWYLCEGDPVIHPVTATPCVSIIPNFTSITTLFFATHWTNDAWKTLAFPCFAGTTKTTQPRINRWTPPPKKKKNDVFFEDHIPFQLPR